MGTWALSSVASGLTPPCNACCPLPACLQLGGEGDATAVELSPRLASFLMQWNAEALGRCVHLSRDELVPFHIRLLFNGEGPFDGSIHGCLMEQLARWAAPGCFVVWTRGCIWQEWQEWEACVRTSVSSAHPRSHLHMRHATCTLLT